MFEAALTHGVERTVKTEAPFTRTVALFALYTFFNTQPSGSAPTLRGLSHIPIPIGASRCIQPWYTQ
jgi:hypothetical protein